MEHEKDKLNRFINAVNSVTDKQVAEIISEAEQERDSILSAAKDAAKDAAQRHLNDNLKMTSNKYVRMVSKAELDMKKQVLVCRERLTEELFEKIRDKLSEYISTPEYEKALCEAVAQEQNLDNARICVSPADMRFAAKIRDAAGEKAEIAADESIVMGGFYIHRKDKGTITDRTFECALKEQHSLFASRNLMTSQEGR